jgi:HTH-type transcriptional repressor of NAD biosynthesis genes
MSKVYKNGLCLGKFMPIHAGHVNMIREAANSCETVHVMVCSRECEPIYGFKRQDWVKEIFKDEPNIKVILCEDENPQYPEDHPDFWKIWHDSVYKYVPELDAVFASEDYVYPFAKALGVEAVMVDKNRDKFPVSGTDIRQDPFSFWDYIPNPVKEQYRLKVCIVGPESSGKSTLLNELSNHYNAPSVAEYGRWYTENKVAAKDLQPQDFVHIAGEQHQGILSGERICDKLGSKYLFIDTDANVTRTFFNMYGDKWNLNEVDVEYNENKILEYMILQMLGGGLGERRGKIDLFLLTYPDLEWEDDGTRDFNKLEDRMRSFKWIKAQLDSHGCKYHIIMGKGERRTEKAIEIINHSEKEFREKPWHKLSFDR